MKNEDEQAPAPEFKPAETPIAPQPDQAPPQVLSPSPEITPAPENAASIAPTEVPPVALPVPPKKTGRKAWLLFFVVLVLLAGAAAAYVFLKPAKDDSKTGSASKSAGVVLHSSETPAANTNRSSSLMALGTVRYDQVKLATLPTPPALSTALKQITPETTTDNRSYVAFYESDKSSTDTSLVMYDFKTNTTRTIIAESGEQRSYSHPVIMSDHYVAFYTLDYTTPVDLVGSIRVIDLLTGEQKTLVKDKAGNLPDSFCCSVSPNGLYLAIPQLPHTISLYAAGGEVKQLTTTATFTPGNIPAGNDYTAAELAGGYAPVRWLDDNSLVLANKPAASYNKNLTAVYSNNGLSRLDIATNTLTPLTQTNNYPITWFDVANGTLAFTSAADIYSSDGTSLKPDTNTSGVNTSTKPFETVSEDVLSYKLDSDKAPVKLGRVQYSIEYAKLLDPVTMRLYVEGSAAGVPITTFDLKTGTPTAVYGDKQPHVGSLLDDDTMVYILNTTSSSTSFSTSTQINLFHFSTNQTTTVKP